LYNVKYAWLLKDQCMQFVVRGGRYTQFAKDPPIPKLANEHGK